jgi:hypothetical protein
MEKKNKIVLILVFLVVFLFLLFIGSGNVISPYFGNINVIDEGLFGAWITHMLHGEFLYKNTYSAYGPFYIYPLYLISKIFTPDFFLIRVLYGTINTFLAILVAELILIKLKIRLSLQIFAIALLSIIPAFGLRQGFGLLSIFFSLAMFERKRYIWSALAGITLGVTYLVSSDIAIFITFSYFVLLAINFITNKNINALLKKQLVMFLGLSGVFIVFFLWSNSEGWFYSYLKTILGDLSDYSGMGIPIGQKFPDALLLLPHSFSFVVWIKYLFSKNILIYWEVIFYLITFVYLFVKLLLKKIQNEDVLVLLIAVFGFLLTTILIGRMDHVNFTLPPLFILFAYFLNILVKQYSHTKLLKEKCLFGALILLILIHSARQISIYRPHFPEILNIPKYVLASDSYPNRIDNIIVSKSQYKSIRIIQEFISKNTKQTDKVFFFSNEPAMYSLVDRLNPNRFDLPEVANTKEKRLEIIASLEKDKTKYVIEDTKAYSVDDINNRVRLPEVFSYIQRKYTKKIVGQYIVYVRI